MSEIVKRSSPYEIAVAANHAAASAVLSSYRKQRARQTLRRQDADLRLFEQFLEVVGIDVDDLNASPDSWAFVTWGLVAAFVEWMLQKGYAIGSVNVRLSTVKTYAKLAFKAGALLDREAALIQTVQGYRAAAAINIDNERDVTSLHAKTTVSLNGLQVRELKRRHDDTPQGRRDALLMCILLDHGLRISEVELLRGDSFHDGYMTFYRPKVNKTSTHVLSDDTTAVLARYMPYAPADPQEPFILASLKNGELTGDGISATGISDRVRVIGTRLDIHGLSAHDCRHSWATRTARKYPNDPFGLQEAGGWSSLAMPRHYVESAKVHNERVRL